MRDKQKLVSSTKLFSKPYPSYWAIFRILFSREDMLRRVEECLSRRSSPLTITFVGDSRARQMYVAMHAFLAGRTELVPHTTLVITAVSLGCFKRGGGVLMLISPCKKHGYFAR